MGDEDGRLHSPSVLRNREPLLHVLAGALPERGLVFEIASGSGEHVVHFGRHLPHLTFQPSDPNPVALGSIAAWIAQTDLANVCAPLQFDVLGDACAVAAAEAVVCINMIHIAPFAATPALMRHAASMLAKGAPLCLYGPFRQEGVAFAPGNEEFDRNLRAQDSAWGVRQLEKVAELARAAGFEAPDVIEMPANNLCVVFRRS